MGYNVNQFEKNYIDTAGTYDCRIVKAVITEDRNGEPAFEITLEDMSSHRTHRSTMTVNPDFGWKLLALAKAAGCTDEERDNLEPEDLIGKEVKATFEVKGKYCNLMNTLPTSGTASEAKTNAADDLPF